MFVQYPSPIESCGAFRPASCLTNMKLFWTIAAVLLVAACTPMAWVRADADAAQAQADGRECQMQAWQEARWRAFSYQTMYGPIPYRDALGRTYVAWPRPMYDPFADPYMEEQRLTSFCMRSKGYELQPTN
jgi:hypothetical protein